MAQPVLAPVRATSAHPSSARAASAATAPARAAAAAASPVPGPPVPASGAAASQVRGVPAVEVASTVPDRAVAEFLLDADALDPTTLALAAARADVVRVVHSAALPTPAAVRALVEVLEDEVRALGRDRGDVRVVLEVEAVVAADAADAARRRAAVAYAEAFAALTWSPSATWLVAPAEVLVADAAALAARTGVDAVALALVGDSRRSAATLAALAAR